MAALPDVGPAYQVKPGEHDSTCDSVPADALPRVDIKRYVIPRTGNTMRVTKRQRATGTIFLFFSACSITAARL